MLSEGLGYEVSSSRVEFAKYMHSNKVLNRCENFLEANIEQIIGKIELVIGVDIVYQIIAPLCKDSSTIFFEKIKQILKPGGFIILELNDYSDIKAEIKTSKEGELKFWQEFDETDQFQYMLTQLSLDKNEDLLWNKIFIKRFENEKEKMRNVIRSYTSEEITNLLQKNGFLVQKYDYYHERGDVDRNEYIILAKMVSDIR